MKINHKIFFYLLGIVLFLSSNSETFAQKKSTKKTQIKITTQQLSKDEKRKAVEALLLQGKYQHDGSVELANIGTLQSVPALLKVLEDNPPIETNGKKSYICTYSHAVSALKNITGQTFVEFEKWKNWWENYQKDKSETK